MKFPGDKLPSGSDSLAFLSGGGEMGSLIRTMDWSKTSLGPVAGWPQSLRTTVSICLASDLPICVIWGPGLVQLYNDAYRVICGGKHPHSMGQNFSECWKEAWPVIGEVHDSALAGDKAFLEVQQIFLERHGYVEECFFTFSFSPIRDEAGRVGGLFHPVIEMTAQMLSERRTRALRDLAAQTGKAKSVSEALLLSAQTLAQYDLDLPFTLLYALEPGGDQARLIGTTGLKEDTVASPSTVTFGTEKQALWPLEEVVRSGLAVQIDDVSQRIGSATFGPYPESPNAALALPITPPGADRPVAIFIAGVSSRLAMNEAYRGFYDLLASALISAVSNAQAHDDERRRAKALAELDGAKTAFFSNVSHEFRTPLTLMLGPVEDALASSNEQLPPLQRERLELVYRNGLRLQRLVNSLLDFSQIEAGRVSAAYESTALADFTADLTSNFRSACEKAGLKLRVDCRPLGEPVFVDRPMWEKIVFNLLSNAFKFTFDGEITVSLRRADGAAELCVRDTGTGIPAQDVPRLFERFYRVENARGRTHEGSGIGLALVQELVKLHGGSISATSEVGRGTTFTVLIPLGSQHLPRDQVGSSRTAAQPTTEVSLFVEEALRWLPDVHQRTAPGSELPSCTDDLAGLASSAQRPDDDRPLVLVADDNADMRQYIVRLLSQHYRTEAVPDGEAALAAARARTPDLVLTDVMMPRLDGFGLLQALRADPRTVAVPVIMLSARAGEESRIEGMQEGADDYLVKPFSAKELLARVMAHLQMARMRRESSAAIQASDQHHRLLFEQTVDGIFLADAAGRFVDVNTAGSEMLGYSREEVLARSIADVLEPDEVRRIEPEIALFAGGQVVRSEWRFRRKDGSVFLGEISGRRLPDGRVQGLVRDITERRTAEVAIRAGKERVRTILESITDGFFSLDRDWRFTYINAAGERFLDHTPGNLIGKVLWDEFPGTAGSEFEQVYRRVVARQVSESFTAYYPNFDRWYEVNAYPAPEGLSVYFRDVTDRRKLEQERQQFAALVDASSDFIGVAGIDQRGVYVNRAGQELVGLEPGQVASINLLDFFPESERDRIVSLIVNSEGGEQVVIDTWFQHLQTGQLIPVSWSFLRLRDASGNVSGYATVTRDLSERTEAEELLRASEERRRLALDAAELGMWHVEPATRATTTDARYRAIFGTTEKWTDYLQAVAVIHPDDQPAVLEAVAAATRVEDPAVYAIEYRIVHPDGSLRWVLANGLSSFKGAGTARRVVSFDGTVADITDRKRGEEEREQLVARLQEQDQRKDEFLATLAHELRNPLAPISNGLQVMRLAKGDPQATERVCSMMERQLGQMVHLIDDLLDLSRISRGKIDLRKERIELARAIEQAIEASRPAIEQADHELLIEIPPDPIYLDADLTRLTQVFSNLLNNAAKYTERGGRIRLRVEHLGGEAVVSVKDNGIGIPTHMLPHVFEMFTQVDRDLERSQGGLGIGLSIVQRLVEMHGGSVEARSDGPGKGSEFVVRLPVALSLALNQPAGEANPVRPTARLRILVADDNLDAAESLAMLLTLEGNETQTAHDGLEALDVAATFRPDALLLDIGMPKLNGYEVCRRIRQQAWGKNIVVIALTGWGQEEDKRRTLAAGVDAHLVKPVNLAALKKLLTGMTAGRGS